MDTDSDDGTQSMQRFVFKMVQTAYAEILDELIAEELNGDWQPTGLLVQAKGIYTDDVLSPRGALSAQAASADNRAGRRPGSFWLAGAWPGTGGLMVGGAYRVAGIAGADPECKATKEAHDPI